jgi:hypothetical protein
MLEPKLFLDRPRLGRSRPLAAAALLASTAMAAPAAAAYAPASPQDHVANQLNAQELRRVTREYPLYGPPGGGYPPPSYAPYGGIRRGRRIRITQHRAGIRRHSVRCRDG